IQENLLTNASKYTPDGGRICIELIRTEEHALIRVSDTGRGIEPDKLESIFDLFMQGESKLDRSDGGMGVGLTLVRTLVSLHGGSVKAFSHGRNKGSVFEVTLPLAVAVSADEGDPESTKSVESGDGIVNSATILKGRAEFTREIVVVEDNEDARDVLKLLLELDGHRVRIAADGASGLEMITRQPPDVALVDIGLPGLDGYEVARRLCARFGDSGPRLLALSGYGRPEDRRAVREAGFERLLVKPVSQEQLRQALSNDGLGVDESKPPSVGAS